MKNTAHVFICLLSVGILACTAPRAYATSSSPRPSVSGIVLPTVPPVPTVPPIPSFPPFPSMPPMPTPPIIDTRRFDVVFVSGTVTDAEGNPAKDATVSVVCNGITHTKTTNVLGMYFLTFNQGECHNGDTVTVNGVKGDTSGSNSNNVSGFQSVVNVQLVNVSVPELGTVMSMLAATGSLGAFYLLRRKVLV